MIPHKEWLKENWMYYTPIISWVNRPYHWIKRDEDDWDAIDHNLMCATGNIIAWVPLQIALIILIIIEKLREVS